MCGFAQQRACKFTCQSEACTPKSSSVRTAHGGLKNRQSTLSANKKAHLAIRSLLFGWIRLIAQGCTCANCPSVSTERWFDTQSVWLFENSLIHPAPQRKTAQKSPHQASDIAKLWLCVLSVLVLRASIGCAVVPRKSC